KSQLEAERNYVRARLYHSVWEQAISPEPGSEEKEAQLRAALNSDLPEVVKRSVRESLERLERTRKTPSMSWEEARTVLTNDRNVTQWMKASLVSRYPSVNLGD